MKYLKGSRRYIFLSVVFAAVSVALTLYVPILTGRAVDCMVGEGNVLFESLLKIIATITAATLINSAVQWVMSVINNRVTYSIVRKIRREAFKKIQSLPLSFIDSHPSGDIVSRVIADVDQFADGLLMGLTQFFTGVMTILGTLGFMIYINLKITLVVVLVTPISFVAAWFIAKMTHSMFKLRSETQGEETAFIDEMIAGRSVVASFSKEEEVSDSFDEINDRLNAATLKAVFFSSITNPTTRFVNALVYALVGLSGAIAAVNGNMSIGKLSSFLSYANQYTKPFNEISGVVTELQNALVCAGRIFEIIEEPSEISDCDNPINISEERGNVEIENVSFSYESDKKLIENLNLNVKKGQRVAIVGPTGCGKTTIINLLMRFYDPDKGEIKIEGVPIENMTRENLRKGYGMVLQETWLKHGTVKENISFGKEDATDEEIIEAAKAAHAHSFIKRLPKGYDTVISESGGMLSQGQKQLLCIARVMLLLPPMLILDEATSSIDTRTEIRIQKAFASLMEGRTSFIVAHRLSTIRESDVILVMRDGHIVEQGNHESLMAKHGFYEQLYLAGQNK
jgi:ATP-binding cassette subfamily B protein